MIEARKDLTGKIVRDTTNPIPTAPSLWATSTGPATVSITGAGFQATGRVHSEGGIQIVGAATALTGGAEYATTLTTVGKSMITPAAAKTAAVQGTPPTPFIGDYRPCGPIATSGVAYRAISPSACQAGTWAPSATEPLTGVVYVPCGVNLVGSARTVSATIAAEGPIKITGSGITSGPSTPGAPSLITAASGSDAISVIGANNTIMGTAYAPAGTVKITGTRATLQCGVVASAISITGASSAAPMSSRCISQ